MDHIPRPHDCSFPEEDVTCLYNADMEYDYLGFLDFPSRKGINTESWLRAEDDNLDWGEIVSFTQSWCFFGLAVEMFKIGGITVSIEDFITRDSSEQPVVTTKGVPELLRIWALLENGLTGETASDQVGDWLHVLGVAREYTQSMIGRFNSIMDFGSFVETEAVLQVYAKILLSVQLLGEALSAVYHIYGLTHLGGWWGEATFARKRLRASGRCKREVLLMEARVEHATVAHFIGVLPPGKNYGQEDHAACTTDTCSYEAVDETTYVTRHSRTGCTCAVTVVEDPLFKAQLGPISAAVQADSIPLVCITTFSHSFAVHAKVVSFGSRSENTSQYVAISHVWRDGLGNPHANALPICQLTRIQHDANALFPSSSHPVLFWIDSICVPLTSPYRRMAIAAMRKVYKDATKVLVYDSELLPLKREDISPAEAICRILFCGWTRRLWTLQEAAFAKELYFQFSDGAVSIQNLIDRHLENQIAMIHDGLIDDAVTKYKVDRGKLNTRGLNRAGSRVRNALTWLDPLLTRCHTVANSNLALGAHFFGDDSARNLQRIARECRTRTTSRRADEALCLGALLDADVGEIAKLPGDKRMAYLLASMRHVPSNIVFLDEEYVMEDGRGWVPKTLLGIEDVMDVFMSPAVPVQEGLLVVYEGMAFTLGPGFHGERYYEPRRDHWVQAIFLRHAGVAYRIQHTSMKNEVFDMASFTGKELVAIGNELREGITQAALCEVRRHESDTIYCRRLATVLVYSKEAFSLTYFPEDEDLYLDAQLLPETQKWCIG